VEPPPGYDSNNPIHQKWLELAENGLDLGWPETGGASLAPSPYGTSGQVVYFPNGRIYQSSLGIYEVHGAILSVYLSEGEQTSELGFPVSDEHKDPNSMHQRSNFEGGYIAYDNAVGGYRAYLHNLSLRWPLVGIGSPSNRSISGYHFGDHWENRHCITSGLATKKLLHTGVDYGAPNGTDVVATHDGVVRLARTDGTWGGYVVIESYGGGYTTTYTHVTPSVTVGTDIDEGDKIGDVVLFSHLHFQVRMAPYDPTWSLAGRLPEVECDAGRVFLEPAFPENFINPEIINWR